METWKPVRDFPRYDVSNEGQIKNVRTQHILVQSMNDLGYMRIDLRRNGEPHRIFVHKLVADAFLGEHPGMIVRHRDGNRSNNRVENLYWSSQSEAIKDAYVQGSKVPYQSKQVRVIETGKVYSSMKECAKDVGCDRSQIYQCLNGRCKQAKGYHVEWA